MEQHIHCYRSDRTAEHTVLSSCPCTCHEHPERPDRSDWFRHNQLDCESWVNTRFQLESAQVDNYRREIGHRLDLERECSPSRATGQGVIDRAGYGWLNPRFVRKPAR